MKSTLIAAAALLVLAAPARAAVYAFENGVYGLPTSHISGDPHQAFDSDQLTISVSDAAVARGNFIYSSVRYPGFPGGSQVTGDVADFQGFTTGGGPTFISFTSPANQPAPVSSFRATLSFGPTGDLTATSLNFTDDEVEVDLTGSGGNSVAGFYVLGANSHRFPISGQFVRLDSRESMPEPCTLALLLASLTVAGSWSARPR